MKDLIGFVLFVGTVIGLTVAIALSVPKYWAGVVLFIGFGYAIFHNAIHNFFLDEKYFEQRFSWIVVLGFGFTGMALNSWNVALCGVAFVGVMFWTGGYIALHRALASVFKGLFSSIIGLFAKH